MSIFSRIFSNRRKVSKSSAALTAECEKLLEFNRAYNQLLSNDKFLARSDYKHLLTDECNELDGFFSNQQTAKTLDYYCSINGIDFSDIECFLQNYLDLSNLTEGSEYIWTIF